MTKRIIKYNPAFLTDEELRNSFAVRQTDFDIIMRIIRENTTNVNQHVLAIGPRGIGKTTLLLRIGLEVRTADDLKDRWYPLVFAEESYGICSVGEFWLEALFHVAQQTGDKKWDRIVGELNNEKDDKRLSERALAKLLDFADAQGKRLLLIVENFNMLFENQVSDDDAWSLRHTLINEPRIMLLASATSKMDQVENSGSAMYELFKQHELKPLETEECRVVWEAVTGQSLKDDRIRPIQILTGGNPRLLSIISSFGSKLSFQELMGDLLNLVDDNTEYFKSHLDNLPTVERKAYLALAELWDPAPAKEIARLARLDVSKTSSLMARLVSRGAVKVSDESKRTKLYQTTERMYNIYYLMRKRGAPSERVKAVVNFMVSFYGHDELMHVTSRIVDEACSLTLELCKDHVFTYEAILQRIASCELRHKIASSTPSKFKELSKQCCPDYEQSEFKMATGNTASKYKDDKTKLATLKRKIKRNPKDCESLAEIAELSVKFGKYLEAEDAISNLLRLQPKCPKALDVLADILSTDINRYDEAEKIYKKLIKSGKNKDYYWAKYGQFLHNKVRRNDEAEQAYRKATDINPDNHWAWEQLGMLLHGTVGRYEEAEYAYKMAIKAADDCPIVWQLLGTLLKDHMNSPKEAQKAFVKAVQISMQDIKDNPISTDAINALSWSLYKCEDHASLQKAYEWIMKAIALEPEDLLIQHTYACVLAALNKGNEAIPAAQMYIKDSVFVLEQMDEAIELFAGLTAASCGQQALDMLVKSPIAENVEPLIVGIRLYLGEEVQVATEILEVAKDVRHRIEKMRVKIEESASEQKVSKRKKGVKSKQ
jgi:tetratricopeptide (TPR) repeat protein